MIEMAHVERIRWLLHAEGKSQRQVAKALGISRHTVAKYVNETSPPTYRRQEPYAAPVLTKSVKTEIERMLAENETLPRKQRWIGRTMYEALVAQGYQGSEPSVRRYLAQLRKEQRKRTAYIPLEYKPGETAEFDWGEAQVILNGQRITVQLACYRLRWSGMPFVRAYPNQRQEAMFDSLRSAFEVTGGAPQFLTSDNLKQAVLKMLEGRNRIEQDAYRSFRTHYLVQSNFCNRAAGNEKGSVENLVGFAQRNIVGPNLEVRSWTELNEVLWQRCLTYAQRTLKGKDQPIEVLWKQEQRVLRPLPQHPYDCGRNLPASSSGISCVTFDTNQYSVPVRYANQALTLRAYWDRVDIYHGLQRIATHGRVYGRHQDVLELDHYLDLLLHKPGALAQAKPLRAADLPSIYHLFHKAMRDRDPRGDREFVRILLLHREFPQAQVAAALEWALQHQVIHYDAVRRHLLQIPSSTPAPLATGALPDIRVRQPALAQYDRILKGGAVH